jgi:hypothetical protein
MWDGVVWSSLECAVVGDGMGWDGKSRVTSTLSGP